MNTEFSSFAARLREIIANRPPANGDRQFSKLAVELFTLQFQNNPAYRRICEARGRTPQTIDDWTQIPFVPTGAFKELELTCLPPLERTAVFHSSGTTDQKPSRHFHGAESLALYEASLWEWFAVNVLPPTDGPASSSGGDRGAAARTLLFLTPRPAQAPHSSLVHMFETVRRRLSPAAAAGDGFKPLGVVGGYGSKGTIEDGGGADFLGKIGHDGTWTLDFEATMKALFGGHAAPAAKPFLLLGTAFSFVHLADYLAANNLSFQLPAGSRVMETGGYKNRSRALPKAELHALIAERLGVAPENIVCEYGMSELSSQAYDAAGHPAAGHPPRSILPPRVLRFPPWARVQIRSPETGREAAEGEAGLIRVFDLANVYSVAAIQTEDVGIRRGDGFELIGRAPLAEPRGCSLNSAEALVDAR